MPGMAKTLFKNQLTKDGSPEFKTCKAALHDWPHLEHLTLSYGLNFIDIKLASTLLKNYSSKFESVAALICHLSLAVRNGHLMIQIEDDKILPSVKSLWLKEANITADDLKKLEALIIKGKSDLLNISIFSDLILKNASKHATTSLCQFQDMFYFQRYFNFETTVLENFNRIKKATPSIKFDERQISNKVIKLLENKTLLQNQAEAILMASKQTLTFICGGPGTGKTYTAAQLLKVLLECLTETEKTTIKIAIAAPTGKAASNLQKNLGFLTATQVKAKTLHQLLGIKGDGRLKNERQHTLVADIIIIDESSMIDVAMMGHLLTAVHSGARIIFLGDKHQLPSVDAGSMFADMIGLSFANCVTLQVCLRAELQEIVDFGKAINEGDDLKAFEMLSKGNAVTRLELQALNQENLFIHASNQFPVILKENSNPLETLKSFDHYRILSPLRKGLFGVDALNQYFFKQLVKKPLKTDSVTVPIMLLKNDLNLELFNGEVGVLVLMPRHHDLTDFHPMKGDYALFPCKKNGFRKLPALVLPAFEYAYVLSVHKAQGSEFNHVLCLLPEGSEHFGKEVLYTAVTRARQSLKIFGSDEIIKQTISNQSIRLSGLFKRNEYAK